MGVGEGGGGGGRIISSLIDFPTGRDKNERGKAERVYEANKDQPQKCSKVEVLHLTIILVTEWPPELHNEKERTVHIPRPIYPAVVCSKKRDCKSQTLGRYAREQGYYSI